ncbi:hypothetical protein OKW33_006733 [Paraburkholderia atlantica]
MSIGVPFERVQKADTRIVDEHVDPACCIDDRANALRVLHIEGENRKTIGARQHVFTWRAHRRDHAPVAIQKISRDFEAKAGRATGNQDGLHVESCG